MGLGQWESKGQMTVELAVAIPVFVALSLVVFNGMLFLENCAAFDRLALDAIRVYASSPGYGQSAQEGAVLVETCLKEAFPQDYLDVSVVSSGTGMGLVAYRATLHFTPTLFGRGASSGVFGVSLVCFDHSVQLVVDPYRPGAVI